MIYIIIILVLLWPALNDLLISPIVEEDSYTIIIPTRFGENDSTVFLSFETKSPSFWTKEAIYVEVMIEIIEIPPNNLQSFNVRFPYSTYAYPKEDGIEFDWLHEPNINMEKEEEISFYYKGSTTVAYHFQGHFNVVVERSINQTVVDSVVLEDVIEIRSHTERLNYNIVRIELALSVILFIFSIIFSVSKLLEYWKKINEEDKEKTEDEIVEKKSEYNESSTKEKESEGESQEEA